MRVYEKRQKKAGPPVRRTPARKAHAWALSDFLRLGGVSSSGAGGPEIGSFLLNLANKIAHSKNFSYLCIVYRFPFTIDKCKCLGMATRESRHAYFCILQSHRFSKDLRIYLESPPKYSHLIPAMDFPTT